MATKQPTKAARVLCAVTIGGVRHAPNTVIEGVPADVLKANAGELDADPAAVEYAKSEGGAVVQYAADPETTSEE